MSNREVLTDRSQGGPSNRMVETSRSAFTLCVKCSQHVPDFMRASHGARCTGTKVK